MNCLKVKRELTKKSQRQQEIDKYIDFSLRQKSQDYSIKVNILFLYLLNKVFGFGKERLNRFFDESSSLQKRMAERYEDADLFAMEKHLKENVGIDVRQRVIDGWDDESQGKTFL